MFVKVHKNFLSAEDCALLNKVALDNVDRWFDDGWSTGGARIKSRITTRTVMNGKSGLFPPEVIEISERVRKQAGVDKYPIIDDHGSDGIVVSITYNDGDVHEHNDPRSKLGHSAYRCNILSQVPENGGELYIHNNKIDVGVGDLHCYFASELLHKVTKVEGDIPRILWMFGVYIPKKHWSEYGL
jgi:hypothetical protein